MNLWFWISGISVILGWVIAAAFYIALYVFSAISLYTLGKRSGIKHSWLAFIPVIQYYIIGEICEEYQLLGLRITRMGLVTIGVFLIEVVLDIARVTPVLIIIAILKALIFHKFYSLFTQRRALLYTALSLLGNLPLTIILFLIKDAPMYMSAAAYRYPFPDKM